MARAQGCTTILKRRLRSLGWVTITMLSISMTTCVALEHGWTVNKYKGKFLQISDTEGSARLRMETGYDSTVREYIASNGPPDYIYVLDGNTVQFFYLSTNQTATFRRPPLWSTSKVTVANVVPENVRTLAKISPQGELTQEKQIEGNEKSSQGGSGTEPAPTKTATATCFGVHPGGLVLTAYHAVGNAKKITVIFYRGGTFSASILQASPANDVALLQIRGTPPGYLTLADARSARVGEHVFTMGFPAVEVLGTEPKFTDGSISSLSGIGDESAMMQISVPLQHGNSGGPLMNEQGEVLGIVVAIAADLPFLKSTGSLPQNVNWAVKEEYLSPLFVGPPRLPPASTLTEAVERTTQALCIVIVEL